MVKISGIFKPGKEIHDYVIPNDPENNEWYNMALEDIALYFDLMNYKECNYYYFSLTELGGIPPIDTWGDERDPRDPQPMTKEEQIYDYY